MILLPFFSLRAGGCATRSEILSLLSASRNPLDLCQPQTRLAVGWEWLAKWSCSRTQDTTPSFPTFFEAADLTWPSTIPIQSGRSAAASGAFSVSFSAEHSRPTPRPALQRAEMGRSTSAYALQRAKMSRTTSAFALQRAEMSRITSAYAMQRAKMGRSTSAYAMQRAKMGRTTSACDMQCAKMGQTTSASANSRFLTTLSPLSPP